MAKIHGCCSRSSTNCPPHRLRATRHQSAPCLSHKLRNRGPCEDVKQQREACGPIKRTEREGGEEGRVRSATALQTIHNWLRYSVQARRLDQVLLSAASERRRVLSRAPRWDPCPRCSDGAEVVPFPAASDELLEPVAARSSTRSTMGLTVSSLGCLERAVPSIRRRYSSILYV